ncbi:MAG: hypothetical protein PHS98_03825 [Bacilli bacterium]|nr:hypothetical protein [Bacilli bacterium]
MFGKINYIDEIRRLSTAIECMDEEDVQRKQCKILLNKLEKIAKQMAAYIAGDWDITLIEHLKYSNALNLEEGNYQAYLAGTKELLWREQIMLICSSQTLDEKTYFMREYYKDNVGSLKVR